MVVPKVCKSLQVCKSLHMALVGHVTRTRVPLPCKNSLLTSLHSSSADADSWYTNWQI